MGLRTRPLLIYSLGALVVLIAAGGAAALAMFGHIRAGEAELRSRFYARAAALERIRRGIYLSGTLARDYFAEPNGADSALLLARLAAVEQDVKGALEGGSAQLRGDVTAYWKVLDLMTQMARTQSAPGVDAYFRHQLAQRREAMMQIADDIGAALDREWTQGQTELARMYARLRAIFAAELALIVILGIGLSVAAARRLLRLEGETRALSAQLVRAQEQERRSIARELHDEVGQALSQVLLDVDSDTAKARAGLEHVVDEVRRISLALRPSMLDDLGLVPALEWQAREIGSRTGLRVEVVAEESAGELPEAHRTCIYRVAQEALQNSARHAAAGRVRVGLQKNGHTVSLRVEDDGKGFAAARSKGLGLLGMQERVAQLGGHFRVQSEPGRGTTITAELPL